MRMSFAYDNLWFPELNTLLGGNRELSHADLINRFISLYFEEAAMLVPTQGNPHQIQKLNIHGFYAGDSKESVWNSLDVSYVLRQTHFSLLMSGQESQQVAEDWGDWVSYQVRKGNKMVDQKDKVELYTWWKAALMVDTHPTFFRKLLNWKPNTVAFNDADAYLLKMIINKNHIQNGKSQQEHFHFLRVGRRTNNTLGGLNLQPTVINTAVSYDVTKDNAPLEGVDFLKLMQIFDEEDETTWSLYGWFRHFNYTFWFPQLGSNDTISTPSGKNIDEKSHLTHKLVVLQLFNLLILFDKDGNYNEAAHRWAFAPRYKQYTPFAILSNAPTTQPMAAKRRDDDAKDTMHYAYSEMMPFPHHRMYINGEFKYVDDIASVVRTAPSQIGRLLLGSASKGFTDSQRLDLKGFPQGNTEAKLLLIRAYIMCVAMYKDESGNGNIGPGHMDREFMTITTKQHKFKQSNDGDDTMEMKVRNMLVKLLQDMGATSPKPGVYTLGTFWMHIPAKGRGLGSRVLFKMQEEGLDMLPTFSFQTSETSTDGVGLTTILQGPNLVQWFQNMLESAPSEANDNVVHPWGPIFDRDDSKFQALLKQVIPKTINTKDVFEHWLETIDVVIPEQYPGREEIINKLGEYVPQLEANCMTVHEFLTSPYNCSYLPFRKVVSQFEDGETRSPACTRCVRPFYEIAESYYPYGVADTGDNTIEQFRSRPVVSRPRSNIDPSNSMCGKPFDQIFYENKDKYKLTRDPQNRHVYTWPGNEMWPGPQRLTIIYPQIATDLPLELYMSHTVTKETSGKRGRRPAEQNEPQDQYSKMKKAELQRIIQIPMRDWKLQVGFRETNVKVDILKAYLRRAPPFEVDASGQLKYKPVVEEEQATEEVETTVPKAIMLYYAVQNLMHPSFQGSDDSNIIIPKGTGYNVPIPQGFIAPSSYSATSGKAIYNRSKFNYPFCGELHLERCDARSNLCWDCFVELGGTGRTGINLVEKPHSRGKLKLPAPTRGEFADASRQDDLVYSRVNQNKQASLDPIAQLRPYTDEELKSMTVEELFMALDTGTISVADGDRWHTFQTEEYQQEMTDMVDDIASTGEMTMIVGVMDPVKQQQLQAERVAEARSEMQKNYEHLKHFNALVKQIAAQPDEVPTNTLRELMHSFKQAYRDGESLIEANHIQTESQYEHITTNAALVLGEKKFDRHMYRYEELLEGKGRIIHDLYLRQAFERYRESSTQHADGSYSIGGINFKLPTDLMFAVHFPDLQYDKVNGIEQQYRSQKMTHLMITYVLHRRAAGQQFNQHVINQITKATTELFGNQMHKLINFGKTLRKRDGRWVVEDVGEARKATNMDNHPGSYKFDTFLTHVHYHKVTGGVEIAPITKFFHFHMIVKIVHYGKLMFDYYKMNSWLKDAFLGNTHQGKFYIADIDGTPFYKLSDRPMVDLRLYDQDDWEEVAHEYVRKDQMQNKDTNNLITAESIRSLQRGF